MEPRFFKCEHCGNIIAMVKSSGVSVVCCGEKMKEIIPGVIEASHEKHIPTYEITNNEVIVKVGSVLHPMSEEHYIEWIFLQTKRGNQRIQLHPGEEPVAKFALVNGDEVEAVYAYCNLHGLWKK